MENEDNDYIDMKVKNIILSVLLTALTVAGFAAEEENYPGKYLVENKNLLKLRIENMQSVVLPEYSDELRKRLKFLLKTRKVYTENTLGRMLQYYPLVDSIFTAHQIPLELKYVAFIESSMKPRARSRAGAVGMWQFVEGTADMLGLRTYRSVDERMDPYAATHAAVKYFKELHGIYGDWTLVLLAYNSGPGRVNAAIKKADGARDFASIKEYLPKETRDYVPKFLASKFFFDNHREFGFTADIPDMDYLFTTRRLIHKKVKFKHLSLLSGLQEEKISSLNPAFQYSYIPESEQGYHLVLPKRYAWLYDSLRSESLDIPEEDFEVETEDDVIVNPNLEHYITVSHRVRGGQTLDKIARLYGLNYHQLKYWNGRRNYGIKAGESLDIHLLRNNKTYQILAILYSEKSPLLPSPKIEEIFIKHVLGKEKRQEFENQAFAQRKRGLEPPEENHHNAMFLLKGKFGRY